LKVLFDALVTNHIQKDRNMRMKMDVNEKVPLKGVLKDGKTLSILRTRVVTKSFTHIRDEL
jgi:hypothetical protein